MNMKIDRRYDPENKLESVKEENTTPAQQEERNDKLDKDSIDSDIMKDLEVYRKE
jgi:hypothetical protein